MNVCVIIFVIFGGCFLALAVISIIVMIVLILLERVLKNTSFDELIEGLTVFIAICFVEIVFSSFSAALFFTLSIIIE